MFIDSHTNCWPFAQVLRPGEHLPLNAITVRQQRKYQPLEPLPNTLTPVVQWSNGTLQAVTEWAFTQDQVTIQMVPLAIGHAMTMHKCVGAEEDYIKVMLNSKNIPYALAYLALGRTRLGKAGLELPKDFTLDSIRTDPEVILNIEDLLSRANHLGVVKYREPGSLSHIAARVEQLMAHCGKDVVPPPLATDSENPCMQVQDKQEYPHQRRNTATMIYPLCADPVLCVAETSVIHPCCVRC